jgi:hypothetical protein
MQDHQPWHLYIEKLVLFQEGKQSSVKWDFRFSRQQIWRWVITLKMEALSSSGTSVNIYQTTQKTAIFETTLNKEGLIKHNTWYVIQSLSENLHPYFSTSETSVIKRPYAVLFFWCTWTY